MLRFTIRDLLWLMVVVGMGILWNAEYRQRTSSESHADYMSLMQECERLRAINEANRHIVKKAIDGYKAQKASPVEN